MIILITRSPHRELGDHVRVMRDFRGCAHAWGSDISDSTAL